MPISDVRAEWRQGVTEDWWRRVSREILMTEVGIQY